jgi:hypothetical protein
MSTSDRVFGFLTIAFAFLAIVAIGIGGKYYRWEAFAWPVITISWTFRALLLSKRVVFHGRDCPGHTTGLPGKSCLGGAQNGH